MALGPEDILDRDRFNVLGEGVVGALGLCGGGEGTGIRELISAMRWFMESVYSNWVA